MCILVTTELVCDLMSTLASGNTVPVARRLTAMSRASALAVVTDTGGAAGVAADAPGAGAEAPGAAAGAALAAGLGAAASAGFLSLQPGKTKAATTAHKAKE
jgi:hypothetical protein